MLPEYDFSKMDEPVQGKYHEAYKAGHTVKIHKEDGTVEVHYFTLEDGSVLIEPDIQIPPSIANLSAELSRRGLHFLVDAGSGQASRPLSSQELIIGLAQQEDARMHLALIALFLYQPETATAVPNSLSFLNEEHQVQLKLFYTAAAVLQLLYSERLRQFIPAWYSLPNYFMESLSINTDASPRTQLRELGQCHRKLTGIAANWMGSYRYAAERLSTRLAKEAVWAV